MHKSAFRQLLLYLHGSTDMHEECRRIQMRENTHTHKQTHFIVRGELHGSQGRCSSKIGAAPLPQPKHSFPFHNRPGTHARTHATRTHATRTHATRRTITGNKCVCWNAVCTNCHPNNTRARPQQSKHVLFITTQAGKHRTTRHRTENSATCHGTEVAALSCHPPEDGP